MSIWRPLAVLGALSLMTASAMADPVARGNVTPLPRDRMVVGAPEIDPAVMGGAVALLAGGTFLVASRRRRNSK